MTTIRKYKRENVLYGSMRSKEMRAERNAGRTKMDDLRQRQADEKGTLGRRQHSESQALIRQIDSENAHDQNHGINRDRDKADNKRRKDLSTRHERERSALHDRHQREMQAAVDKATS
jgi:hypothetical protein